MSSEVQQELLDKGGGGGEIIEESEKCKKSKDEKTFTKPENRKPGKFNLPKHRKLKRLLSRQSSNKKLKAARKRKHENFKFGRKRSHSGGKFFSSGYKRRNKELGVIIPPTKFLLGGNICDPLNLNSLQDEEINRAMNAVTPKSSPLPTPRHRRGEIEVIIPRNIKDPLNLISGGEDDLQMDLQILSKRNRKRHRKRKRASSSTGSGKEENIEITSQFDENQVFETSENKVKEFSEIETDVEKLTDMQIEGANVPQSTEVKNEPPPVEEKQAPKKELNLFKDRHRARKMEPKDKIVSPVIPQPGTWKRPLNRTYSKPGGVVRKKADEKLPEFKTKNTKYQYGNYDRYYGYRNPNHEMDVRLQCFIHHKELFLDKDILDIGCNVGHITLSVARDFGAKSAVGLDIDKKLINIARKNVKHYVNFADTPAYSGGFSIRNPAVSPYSKTYPFQDTSVRNTPMYSYPESPLTQRTTPHYCQESPSYTPSGIGTYYPMESPSYQPSVMESPNYQRSYQIDSPRRSYNIESPSYLQHSPSCHSGRNTPFYSSDSPNQRRSPNTCQDVEEETKNTDKFFPVSMPILYGPVDPPGISTQKDSNVPKTFPHNVTFVQGNYVLESDALLATETPQFDIILCLSITKWIHLNWGDAGLKQAFRRMFSQLRPGGKLILEAQRFSSYKKKKNLTETIYRNYHSIEFMPEQFTQYLLSPEVGFAKVEVIGTPAHSSKGFRRPIEVFTKPDFTPSRSNTPGDRWTPGSVRYTPYAERTCVRKPVYTSLTVPTHELDTETSLSPPTENYTNVTSPLITSASPPPPPADMTIGDMSDTILQGSEVNLTVMEDVPRMVLRSQRTSNEDGSPRKSPRLRTKTESTNKHQ